MKTHSADRSQRKDVIAGARRACLHEILMLVMGKSRAYENVKLIMHMCFSLMH
jgi:hypothetical protein